MVGTTGRRQRTRKDWKDGVGRNHKWGIHVGIRFVQNALRVTKANARVSMALFNQNLGGHVDLCIVECVDHVYDPQTLVQRSLQSAGLV